MLKLITKDANLVDYSHLIK